MYSGLLCSITGGGSKKDDAEKKKEDVLNIFSVASGHLYERFLRSVTFSSHTHTLTLTHTHIHTQCHSVADSLAYDTFEALEDVSFLLALTLKLFHVYFRIMMLSVLRHTKTPVKFWFLKNYLSPSFKVLYVLHDFTQIVCFPACLE